MTYSASLQPIAFLMRVHEGGGGEYLDPYCWFTSVTRCGDTAVLQGMDRPITPAMWRGMRAALHAAGFRWATWERVRDDGAKERVTWPVTRPPSSTADQSTS